MPRATPTTSAPPTREALAFDVTRQLLAHPVVIERWATGQMPARQIAEAAVDVADELLARLSTEPEAK